MMEENVNVPLTVKPEPSHHTDTPSDRNGSQVATIQSVPEHRQPMQVPSNSVPAEENEKEDPEKNGKESNTPKEDLVDSESIKGIFGWETMDDTSIPYILRKGKKFVSVRIVERKLLSKYPNTFPDELGKKDPLVSYFITEAEANLLNEINTAHCDFEYGHNPFTVKDLIVDLVEFGEFFKIVKKTFPADVLAKIGGDQPPTVPPVKQDLSYFCGWIQINNTVSPYILRVEGVKQVKLVPLSVIVYAAGLLSNSSVDGLLPTPQECAMLNEACKTAGFDFTFGKNTRLISITEVLQRCQVQLFDLPFKNPLQHARYLDPRTGQPSSNPLLGVSHPVSTAAMIQPPPPLPVRATSAQQTSIDAMSACPTEINPFMPSYPRPGLQPPHPGMPGFRGPTSVALMRSAAPHAGMGVDSSRFHGPQSQMMPDKNMEGGGILPQGIPGSLWPAMPRAPPPAHANNSSSTSLLSKTPPIVSETPKSSAYQHHSLPVSSLLHHKTSPTMPDLNHPIFRGPAAMPPRPPVSQAMHNDNLVRYPPPVTGLPPPPSQYSTPPSLPFGVNQFNSSLFARTDLQDPMNPGDNRPTLSQHRRRSGESPKLPMPHTAARSVPQNSGVRSGVDRTSHISTSCSTSNNNHQKPSLSQRISACLVNGKSISCLNVDSPIRKGSFCLVEAVSKLYFPTVPLAEFVKVLQHVLNVNLYECSPEEEAAFVRYYNLPVSKLKCNKIVKVDDLENYFPQLNYMFTKCPQEPGPGQLTHNQTPQSAHNQAPQPVKGPQKRTSSSPIGEPPAKLMQPKLENAHKLYHGSSQNGGTSSNRGGNEAPVIVIDD